MLQFRCQPDSVFSFFHHISVSGRISNPGWISCLFVYVCARATESLEKTNQQCHFKNSWHPLSTLTTNPAISLYFLPFSTLAISLCSSNLCLTLLLPYSLSIIDLTSCNSENAVSFTSSPQMLAHSFAPSLLL